jgi:hypothetical protein
MARSVELVNGGKKIELNAFAEQITENIITGIVDTLKGVDTDAEIVITLGKKSGPN